MSSFPKKKRPGFAKRVWRSIVRHGAPNTNRNRSLAVFTNLFLHIHPVKVRRRAMRFRATYYLGGLTAATFFLLVVSGAFLMIYYRPDPLRAYGDMKDLQYVVWMGRFLRNLHRWAAHTMVLLAFLHLCRVFFAAAYKPPREFNWVIGVVLMGLTLLLSYTGYLLPWDQLAFWGVSVGTNIISAMPAGGDMVKLLLLGGTGVGGNALIRFYVLHCFILPAVLTVGIALHIWRFRKDGGVCLPPYEGPDQQATTASKGGSP